MKIALAQMKMSLDMDEILSKSLEFIRSAEKSFTNSDKAADVFTLTVFENKRVRYTI